MKKEEFKDIPGYEGMYQVSNLGRVKSLSREMYNGFSYFTSKEKILKNGKDAHNYFNVNLCKNGKAKMFKIHQLVVMVFLGHKPDGTNKIVVDHINNIQHDNRLENLQLITNRENSSKDKIGKGSSKYTGVLFNKNNKKWKSDITINNVKFFIGYYENEIDAHNAYQKALKDWEKNGIKPSPKKFSSKYKGVSWDKSKNKWTASIWRNGKSNFIGRFNCEEEANIAYQKAQIINRIKKS